MAAPTDQQPVYEVTDAAIPQRYRVKPWHVAVVVALGLPLVFSSGVGAVSLARNWEAPPAARTSAAAAAHRQAPKPHHTKPPAPAFDLAGYQAAISGPEERAFVAALSQFRSDSKHYRFQSLTTDSLSLSGAASAWLTALKATNPPPGYEAAKLDYLMAATLANRAAAKTQSGIASASLTALAQGNALAAQAKAALARAIASAPQATAPQGS